MGQVTIYLDSETEQRMNTIVKATGISKSRWIADIIKEKTDRVWPAHIRKMAGTWRDLPTAEELRKSLGTDSERDAL
jgi:hypothetical protein